jgi:O-antigen ligase
MFHKQLSTEEIIERGDELTTDDIDSSGRFAMWEWSLAHFYKGKEWKGSGLGVLQHAFYTWEHPFGGLRVVHNDYIQILCDTGLIGLILYGLTLLSFIVHSVIIYYRKNKVPIVRLAAIISGVSLAGMLSTLYTDNVVNYSLMTLSYPFALYGMMLGLNRHYKIKLL